MKVRINVEDYHIRNGIKGSYDLCPLALAHGPRIGGHVRVTLDGYVEVTDLYWRRVDYPPRCPQSGSYWRQFDGDHVLLQVPLPPEAFEWVWKSDRGDEVKPFSFEIEVPDNHFRSSWV